MKHSCLILTLIAILLAGCKKNDCNCNTDTSTTDIKVTSDGKFDLLVQQNYESTQKTVTKVSVKGVSKTFETNLKISEYDKVFITISNADSVHLEVTINNNIIDYEDGMNNVSYIYSDSYPN